MITKNSAINSTNVHLKIKRIIKSTRKKPWALDNLRFKGAVTLHGISNFHLNTDRVFVFKFKKLKLQTVTVSRDGF
jgi:hypothetical protein